MNLDKEMRDYGFVSTLGTIEIIFQFDVEIDSDPFFDYFR
jgi:hypothetical protein